MSKARKILTILKILFLFVACDANYQTETSCKENIDVSILSFVLFAPLLTKNIDTNDPDALEKKMIREQAFSAFLLYQISLYEGCKNSPSFDNGFKLLRD